MTSSQTIVASPGFAGGRLRLFNRILAAGPSPQLVLDENLFGPADLRFPIQNAHGDVVSLDVPDHGKLGHGSRAAFRNALLDSLPPTAAGESQVDRFLPSPLMTPLEAATHFWSEVFPDAQVTQIRRGAPAPAATELKTGITWASARHIQAIQELGLEESLVLQGETACQERLVPIPAGELGQATESLRASSEEILAQMRALSEQVDASLVGAWVRLRRNLRESLDEFAERADKCGRNRGGIRRARLHALAQAWRPHDKPQEEGLTLLSAVHSYHLDLAAIETYRTMHRHCLVPETVLRTS